MQVKMSTIVPILFFLTVRLLLTFYLNNSLCGQHSNFRHFLFHGSLTTDIGMNVAASWYWRIGCNCMGYHSICLCRPYALCGLLRYRFLVPRPLSSSLSARFCALGLHSYDFWLQARIRICCHRRPPFFSIHHLRYFQQ